MIRSMLLTITAVFVCFGQVSTQGLIAWYPFNGNVNNMAPGSSLQLTFNPDPSGAATVAQSRALSRLGDSNALKLTCNNGLYGSDAPLPKLKTSRTITAWVYLRTYYGTQPVNVISYGGTGPGKLCQLYVTGVRQCILSNGTDTLIVTQLPTPAAWVHIAIVIKGDTTLGYVNGAPRARKTITTWNTEDFVATNIIIGGKNSTYQSYVGAIDDIAIYNMALSSSEVQALYRASPNLTSTAPTVAHQGQVTQLTHRTYTVLANGQVVRQQPSNLRRLFNLFK